MDCFNIDFDHFISHLFFLVLFIPTFNNLTDGPFFQHQNGYHGNELPMEVFDTLNPLTTSNETIACLPDNMDGLRFVSFLTSIHQQSHTSRALQTCHTMNQA